MVSAVCGQMRMTEPGGSTRTCPVVGSSSPVISLRKVVLPAPLAPTTPVHPSASERLTSRRSGTESEYENERSTRRTNIQLLPDRPSERAIALRHAESHIERREVS